MMHPISALDAGTADPGWVFVHPARVEARFALGPKPNEGHCNIKK